MLRSAEHTHVLIGGDDHVGMSTRQTRLQSLETTHGAGRLDWYIEGSCRMLIVLSPVKKLVAGADVAAEPVDTPYDQSEALLRTHGDTRRRAGSLMRISDNRCAQPRTAESFRVPFTQDTTPHTFAGDVRRLDAASPWRRTSIGHKTGSRSVGSVRCAAPLDRMQPYRLEMGTNPRTRGKNLADLGDRITDVLNERLAAHGPTLVNLVSQEYYGGRAKTLSGAS